MTSTENVQPADFCDAVARLLELGPAVVLTGAGLSTASGIPDYRDDEGRWKHAKPVDHSDFLRFEATRRRYWARSVAGWPVIAGAQPSRAHVALAQLETLGQVSQVITQNVDGLHQKAGSRRVIELHGGLQQVVCLDCEQRHPRHEVQRWMAAANPDHNPTTERIAPDGDVHLREGSYENFNVVPCPACGGMLKPDVVFFGDNVPKDRVAEGMAAIDAAASLLVVGSSLMVYSGYRFALHAHKHGKPVVAVNLGKTRADDILHLKVRAHCDDFFVALLESITIGEAMAQP